MCCLFICLWVHITLVSFGLWGFSFCSFFLLSVIFHFSLFFCFFLFWYWYGLSLIRFSQNFFFLVFRLMPVLGSVLLLLLSLFRVNYYTLYVSFLLSFFLFVFIHRTLWFFFALFLFLFLSLSFFFSHFYFEYRWRVTNVSLQSARFQSGEFLKKKKKFERFFFPFRPLDQTNKQRYLLFIHFLGIFI
jgi:hypothetical protein